MGFVNMKDVGDNRVGCTNGFGEIWGCSDVNSEKSEREEYRQEEEEKERTRLLGQGGRELDIHGHSFFFLLVSLFSYFIYWIHHVEGRVSGKWDITPSKQ